MNWEPISPQLPSGGALELEEEHSVIPFTDRNSRTPDEELSFKSFSHTLQTDFETWELFNDIWGLKSTSQSPCSLTFYVAVSLHEGMLATVEGVSLREFLKQSSGCEESSVLI